MSAWLNHVEEWKGCQRCALGQQRDLICLARGALPADVCFIGEAPGMSEDSLGEPFRGQAGNLLDEIVARALPEEVTKVFTNLVACFPREAKARGDNEPEHGEILACRPRLIQLVNIAKPRLIVHVGTLAESYSNFAGSVAYTQIYHPAYILARMPAVQQRGAVNKCVVIIRNAWEDVVAAGKKDWKTWGARDAEAKQERGYLKDLYGDAERGEHYGPDDDGIPF